MTAGRIQIKENRPADGRMTPRVPGMLKKAISSKLVWAAGGVLVALVAVLVFKLRDQQWSADRIAESRALGQPIIAAIEQYKLAHEKYPESLGELVPEFLPSIPPPTAGNKVWFYQRDTPKSRPDGRTETFTLGIGDQRELTFWNVVHTYEYFDVRRTWVLKSHDF
jgi:hypothetical protein